jgi:hypothetical protein
MVGYLTDFKGWNGRDRIGGLETGQVDRGLRSIFREL